MKFSEFVRTLMCVGAASGGMLLSTSQLFAQDILPSVRWNVDGPAAWSDAGNWLLAGSDPAQDGVPEGEQLAAILNGGTALITSTVPAVQSLSVRSGTVEFGAGGDLTVSQQAVVGDGGTLSFGGGTLTTGALQVPGATIDLSPSFAGDLALGTEYPLATAGTVLGSPSRVTVGGAAPDLPSGQGLLFKTNDTGAIATVSSVPVLQIDRLTGDTTIQNVPGGQAIDLKGYSLTSAGGNLAAATWSSLASQGTEGWNDEVNNTEDSRLTEYSLSGASPLAAGASLGVGTPYGGVGTPPTSEDIEVSFILGDLTVLDGEVQYLGPISDLVLNVDPETGAATVGNNSPIVSFDIASYTILSASDSLVAGNFTGIREEGWVIANPQASALAELNLEGSLSFETGTMVPIGNVFDANGTQDLVFQYSLVEGSVGTGTVIYGDDMPTCSDVAASRAIQGDLDGDGTVAFPDFLVLSANFGTAQTMYEQGDIDCDGMVAFPDFLVLSANFGQSAGATAASVPEPAAGLIAFIGLLGMLTLRKRGPQVAGVLATVCLCGTVMTQQSFAVDFDTQFIRLHPDGPDAAINNVIEARNILNGTDIDGINNEDLSGKLDITDLAGGIGDFSEDRPYLNGVNDDSMNNFLQYVSGMVTIPEGDYSIGCGSDDGCWINIPGIVFTETFNENGPITDGDGQIIFNAGRGHDWTFGNFSVGEGGVETSFEALFNEGGGGDSMEVGISEFQIDPELDPTGTADERRTTAINLLSLLTDGELGWTITGSITPNSPADFNADGVVDSMDEAILRGNFGDSGAGDLNGDDIVNFNDLALFIPAFDAGEAAAASVPEPATVSLALLGAVALFRVRRRR